MTAERLPLREQHQIIAVDELGLVDVAQDRFNLGRRLAQNSRCLLRSVVDEPARDLATILREAADDLAASERAGDGDDPDREEALAFARERTHGTVVEPKRAREPH